MVLRLKAWESKSLPGLSNAKEIFETFSIQIKKASAGNSGGFFAFKIPFKMKLRINDNDLSHLALGG